MAHIMEVIVTSVEEAIEAEAGGADRLELVRALDLGGLTPPRQVVRHVLDAVGIPVRTMLREQATMCSGTPEEMAALQECAEVFADMGVDGFVMGFVQADFVDAGAMRTILSAAPRCPVTFHRAFDDLPDPMCAIKQLLELPQVDRILTAGGKGAWMERKRRLIEWQHAAAPSIRILVGAGISPAVIDDLSRTPELQEIHVGRAARSPHSVSGIVRRDVVQALKSALR